MNEKRFTIDVEETTWENALFENGKFVCFEDDTDEYLKKINEVADENEQLRNQISVLDDGINDVVNENEQLKRMNADLIQQVSDRDILLDELENKGDVE